MSSSSLNLRAVISQYLAMTGTYGLYDIALCTASKQIEVLLEELSRPIDSGWPFSENLCKGPGVCVCRGSFKEPEVVVIRFEGKCWLTSCYNYDILVWSDILLETKLLTH